VALAFGALLAASLALTVRGWRGRAWLTLVGAAGCSALCSLAGIWTLGGAVFLLTCLQLGLAIALRAPGAADPGRWLLVGFATWTVVVPVQLLGVRWVPWIVAFPAVAVAGAVAAAVRPMLAARGGGGH